MRLPNKLRRAVLLASVAWPLSAAVPAFRVASGDASAWSKILGSIGVAQSSKNDTQVVIAGPNAPLDLAAVADSHILVVQGAGPLATQLGFVSQTSSVPVRSVVDTHAPKMKIIWELPATLPVTTVPAGFAIFTKERWTGAPLAAGKRTPGGAVLWLAIDPGANGTERFPYLLQALADLGLKPELRGTNLWSFFDSAYRSRADVDYLASRWRQAGISALHVAAWHNMTPDTVRDEYLKNLIVACHRNAILVYAWLELPHVSEEFWAEHPEWREKTAVGEDAQLDWRKLMNLENPDCKRAVAKQVQNLLSRFDWDGVNLAELYFESLEGASNPARFTPMNTDVRHAFELLHGFDPARLFDASPPRSASHNTAGLRTFLDFRAQLAARMQADWLDVVEQQRRTKPWLDVVLTHIDDRLEPGMKDALGADTERSLPLIQAKRATVLIEDPATLWNLGAARYGKLAEKWSTVSLSKNKLAVDINIVERYQDVYPTKKQTGTELFQLVRQASDSFPNVALYFENSIERLDLQLLSASAAAAQITAFTPDELNIDAAKPVRVSWSGPAELDGKTWPLKSADGVIVPAGTHILSTGVNDPPVTIASFTGKVRSVAADSTTLDLSYSSTTRALVCLNSPAASIDVDGAPVWKASDNKPIVLPSGEHLASFHK